MKRQTHGKPNRALNESFFSPSQLSDKILAFTETISGLTFRAGHFDVEAYSDALFGHYEINEPEFIVGAVKKRKAEFLCGRILARDALKSLGFPSGQIPVGKNRAPVFPKNSLGSISHTNQEAICAAAFESEFSYIGIDVEQVITAATLRDISKLVISDEEESLLCRIMLAPESLFTIVFSAKESIFKALHPSVGCYFDFSAAMMVDICTDAGTIAFRLTKDLSPGLPEKTLVSGRFCTSDNHVLTVIFEHRK